MTHPRTLLFDLDGTLADPRVGIFASLRFVFAQLGLPEPSTAAMEAAIGPPLRVSLAVLLATQDAAQIDAAARMYRERYAEVGITGNTVYRGIPDALASLRAAGFALLVATSKPRVFAERIVERHGLSSHFNAIYGSELDGTLADKRELIAHLLSSEGLESAHCMMIGDRRHDVIGARGNGVAPAGVLWGFGSREELQSHGCERFFADPAELTTLV